MNESPDWTLTGAQRRCLGIALRQIERELATIADFVARAAPTATDPFVDDLDEGARHQLRHAIAEARTVIGELRAAFGLERESVTTSRWIAGQLPRLWVAAEERQARYLRGYGPVPRERRRSHHVRASLAGRRHLAKSTRGGRGSLWRTPSPSMT